MVLAGDPILASDLVTPTYIVKSGAETINNSATLQDDNDLFVDLAVGTWRVELIAHLTSNTTADFKSAWTTTGTITALARTTLGGGSSLSVVTDMTVRMQGLAIGTPNDVGANGTSTNIYREDLLLDVSVAGRLQYQWAQNTATVVDTILTAASRLIITALVAN